MHFSIFAMLFILTSAKYHFAPFLSPAEEECIDVIANSKLHRGDKSLAKDVARIDMQRPNTEWYCFLLDCIAKEHGKRGADVWFIPKKATCDSPRILYLHGGSWILGSPRTVGMLSYASHLASRTDSVVMSIDYPLSPVKNADKILDFMVDAMQYLEFNVPGLNCTNKASSIFVGGDSAGATSALTLALYMMHPENIANRTAIDGVFMFSGWFHLRSNTMDYYNKQFAKLNQILENGTSYVGDLMFTLPAHALSIEFKTNALIYVGFDPKKLTDPYFSPMEAGPELLKGLPPLFFTAGGNEINMGEIIVLSQKTAAAGVSTFCDVYAAMFHDFQLYSEGCDNTVGQYLWQGKTVRRRVNSWIKHIAKHKKPPCFSVDRRTPIQQWHYTEPGTNREWYPTGLCGRGEEL